MRVVFPTKPDGDTHLARGDATLCGDDATNRRSMALQPGMDFGIREHDCRKCLRAWRDMAREVAR